MPVSQSISVPYTSNVTNETCFGIGTAGIMPFPAGPRGAHRRGRTRRAAADADSGRGERSRGTESARVTRRDGPAGVPGQAAVRPPRAEGFARARGANPRGRGRGGGGARLSGRGQGTGADRRQG